MKKTCKYIAFTIITLLLSNTLSPAPAPAAAPGSGPSEGPDDASTTFVWIIAGAFAALALYQSISDAYKEDKDEDENYEDIIIPISDEELNSSTESDNMKGNPNPEDEKSTTSDEERSSN